MQGNLESPPEVLLLPQEEVLQVGRSLQVHPPTIHGEAPAALRSSLSSGARSDLKLEGEAIRPQEAPQKGRTG